MENKTAVSDQQSAISSQQSRVIRENACFLSKVIFSFFVCCFISSLGSLLSADGCLLTAVSYAAEKDVKKDQAPTVITSESLTADNKAKTALFTGSVVAKKGEMTMYADRMLVYYSESGSGGSNIDRIEADGNVKLVRGDRVLTAGKCVYYAGNDERAVFTESPRAAEGKNVVTGTKMTYYMKDDRSVVENSKVYIVEKEPASQDRKIQDKKNQGKKKQ